MSGVLKKIIDATTLRSLVSAGAINKDGVRLFDCTFIPQTSPDWRKFEKEERFGQFKKLLELPSRSKTAYEGAHIPGAVHCDLDVATYPTRYQRFTFYPANVFDHYMELLGLRNGEHVVLYGRGAQGGMLMAARMAWILKSYGQEKVSLLDGGLDFWHKNKFELSNKPIEPKKGDWQAVDKISEFNVSFDDMERNDEAGEKQFMDKTDETRFLDARVRGQFEGTEDTGLDPMMVPASHIPGFVNVPSAEMIRDGVLKTPEEIRKLYPQSDKPIVTICNTGMQASFLAYVIDAVDEKAKPKVYPGSLKEMEKRDPNKISAGRRDIP